MKQADEPALPADHIEAEDKTEPDTSSTDATPSPTRMVPREQQLGWMVAAIAVIGVGASWATKIVHGDGEGITKTAIGLGMAVVLAAAVWYGRRLIAGFAAMATSVAPAKPGSAWSTLSIICLVYGGYLIFRNTLIQRKAAMSRPRRPPRAPRSRSSKAAASAAAAAAADGARRPSANRRYTPPKAKNPRRGR